jgi:hypothetical protein
MNTRPSSTQLFSAVLVTLGLLLAPMSARAIEVKKMLVPEGGGGGGAETGGGAPAPASNPIPKAMQAQLGDIVSQESDTFLDQESEKKSDGKPYVDLEHAKFSYMPAQKEGKWTVQAKLEAAELAPGKGESAKSKPTGKRKALIFNYRLDGSKWTEVEQPKWEDVGTAEASAKKNK